MSNSIEKSSFSSPNSIIEYIKIIGIIASIVISIIALCRACESNRIAMMSYEEPRICIKGFVAWERDEPINIFGNINFQVDPEFMPTEDKIIKYDIENSLTIVNEGAIAAVHLVDRPSIKIKISAKFPYRLFSIGILEIPEKKWTWERSYNKEKGQDNFINIYEILPPSMEFNIVLLYFMKRGPLILHKDQILSEYFKISVGSPKSERSLPCLWEEGKIKRPEVTWDSEQK